MTQKKQEDEYIVLFGMVDASQERYQNKTILITPVYESWNDFGYKIKVVIRVYGPEKIPLFAEAGFIGFDNIDSSASDNQYLFEILKENDRLTVLAKDVGNFFTLLPAMQTYRTLISRFGVPDALKILEKINDLTFYSEFESSHPLISIAEKTEVFSLAFMRNSEAFFAYKNGGEILRGIELQKNLEPPTSISIEFKLASQSNSHKLAFTFDHDGVLPKRIAIVIGENGVGKSQSLCRIVQEATGPESFLRDENGARVAVSRVLAFAPSNEAESVFPSDKDQERPTWYKRFSLNRSNNDVTRVSDLIIQLARSEQYIGESSRLEIFLSAIKAIKNWEQISLPNIGDYDEGVQLEKLIRGGEQSVLERISRIDVSRNPVRFVNGKFYELSSGEISFLKFSAQVSLYIENGSLILLDEPETHLHPHFISRFVDLLNNLLEGTNSSAIIATHSVYFVREVFQSQVIILRSSDNGRIIADTPIFRTFGADVGAISYFVFGEDKPSHLAASVQRRLLAKYKNWDDLYNDYKDELSLEVLGAIREAMELMNKDE